MSFVGVGMNSWPTTSWTYQNWSWNSISSKSMTIGWRFTTPEIYANSFRKCFPHKLTVTGVDAWVNPVISKSVEMPYIWTDVILTTISSEVIFHVAWTSLIFNYHFLLKFEKLYLHFCSFFCQACQLSEWLTEQQSSYSQESTAGL